MLRSLQSLSNIALSPPRQAGILIFFFFIIFGGNQKDTLIGRCDVTDVKITNKRVVLFLSRGDGEAIKTFRTFPFYSFRDSPFPQCGMPQARTLTIDAAGVLNAVDWDDKKKEGCRCLSRVPMYSTRIKSKLHKSFQKVQFLEITQAPQICRLRGGVSGAGGAGALKFPPPIAAKGSHLKPCNSQNNF